MTDELSTEALVVCGAFWGVLPTSELSFERPHVIHPRTRKGLDDLVAAGFLTVERFNNISDKLVWKPTERMKSERPKVSRAFMKDNSFPVTTDDCYD